MLRRHDANLRYRGYTSKWMGRASSDGVVSVPKPCLLWEPESRKHVDVGVTQLTPRQVQALVPALLRPVFFRDFYLGLVTIYQHPKKVSRVCALAQ